MTDNYPTTFKKAESSSSKLGKLQHYRTLRALSDAAARESFSKIFSPRVRTLTSSTLRRTVTTPRTCAGSGSSKSEAPSASARRRAAGGPRYSRRWRGWLLGPRQRPLVMCSRGRLGRMGPRVVTRPGRLHAAQPSRRERAHNPNSRGAPTETFREETAG